MRIFNLSYHDQAITGGHKYNDLFSDYLQVISNRQVINTPSCTRLYPSWRKIYAPFAELKWLKAFQAGDLLFYNDTSHKYHVLLALLVALRRNIDTAVIIHHFDYLNYKGVARFLNFIIQYIYYLPCKTIIVPSPYTQDLAKRLYPHKDIQYIPIPFQKAFHPSEAYEIGRFLYVGTIEERKGLMYLVEAMGLIHRQHPEMNLMLDVVGKIKDEHYYQNLLVRAEALDVKEMIHFRGRVSDEELEDLYQKAEVFTFPSLLEGFGMVIVEAMNKGIPPVVFDNSAMPYLIKDGVNGMLAVNKSAESFAQKLLELTGNKALRCHIQDGMKTTIDHLASMEDFKESIKTFYQTRIGL